MRNAVMQSVRSVVPRALVVSVTIEVLLVSLLLQAAPQDLRLVEAAKRNDPKAAAVLLKPGVPGINVNTAQPDGSTALHWAAHWNDLATADLLIRAGANVNAEDTTGVTPLVLACLNGSRAMVDRLVAAGAQPNAGRPSAVMLAARTGNADVMQILLAHGGDANAKESDRGQTALMWAASEMHPAVLRVLIEHGANVRSRTVGTAPAAMGGRGTAYGAGRGAPTGDGTSRVETAAPPSQAADGQTARGAMPAPAAARGRSNTAPGPTDTDATDALTGRDAGAAAVGGGRGRGSANGANGFTALLFAARVGDLESVRLLLNSGANPNDTADDGMSAL